jgi:hypothetical protein
VQVDEEIRGAVGGFELRVADRAAGVRHPCRVGA